MNIKKILLTTMLSLFIINQTFALNEVKLSDFSGKIWDIFDIKVIGSDINSIAWSQFFIEYDSEIFSYKDITSDYLLWSTIWIWTWTINIIWTDISNPINFTWSKNLFLLKFEVKSNNSNWFIRFNENTNFFDIMWDKVEAKFINSSLNIEKPIISNSPQSSWSNSNSSSNSWWWTSWWWTSSTFSNSLKTENISSTEQIKTEEKAKIEPKQIQENNLIQKTEQKKDLKTIVSEFNISLKQNLIYWKQEKIDVLWTKLPILKVNFIDDKNIKLQNKFDKIFIKKLNITNKEILINMLQKRNDLFLWIKKLTENKTLSKTEIKELKKSLKDNFIYISKNLK